MSCSESGFDALVDVAVVARGEAAKCRMRLDDCEADAAEKGNALASCLALLDKKPPPPSGMNLALGYAVGVVGAVAVGVAIAAEMPVGARTVASVTGLALAVGGFVWVLP